MRWWWMFVLVFPVAGLVWVFFLARRVTPKGTPPVLYSGSPEDQTPTIAARPDTIKKEKDRG